MANKQSEVLPMPIVTALYRISILECQVDEFFHVQFACTSPDGYLVGSAIITYPDSLTPVFGAVYVDIMERGKGLGQKLVEAALGWAKANEKPLFLHVLPTNKAHIMYEAMGFVYTGEVEERGEKWMVMTHQQNKSRLVPHRSETVCFNELVAKTQLKAAQVFRDDFTRRTGAESKPLAEWVRVMQQENTELEIDHSTRRMSVSAASKELFELHVQQHLVEGGQTHA